MAGRLGQITGPEDSSRKGSHMTQLASPSLANPQRPPAMEELHVLWITAGLGCDGDTVSITAATQPSLEDLILGVIPGIPKVRFHNPVLAYETGAEFMQRFHDAAA